MLFLFYLKKDLPQGLSQGCGNFSWSQTQKLVYDFLVHMYRLQQFFSTHQLVTLYRGLGRPCMEYACHAWGGSRHAAVMDRMESNAFRLISSTSLSSYSNSAAVLPLSQSSIAVFMLTVLNLLTACLPSSHGLAVHVFLHKLAPILSKPLMQV